MKKSETESEVTEKTFSSDKIVSTTDSQSLRLVKQNEILNKTESTEFSNINKICTMLK